MANRQLGSSKKCVLYCGPSNKSVDVVLGKMNEHACMPYCKLTKERHLCTIIIDGFR